MEYLLDKNLLERLEICLEEECREIEFEEGINWKFLYYKFLDYCKSKENN